MKAKISRGSGFSGILKYIFDIDKKENLDKKSEFICSNMIGQVSSDLSKEFSVVKALRPDVAKPVWHCSLTLPKDENLSTNQWTAVVEDFLKKMDFDLNKNLYVCVRHKDTDFDHVHIVASRIGLDGKIWLGQWEARRAIEATQAIEIDKNLTITKGLSSGRSLKKSLTDNEINQSIRTGNEPPRQRLQRLVDIAIKGNPSALEFAQRLSYSGVNVRANLASTGRLNGFSFEIDGIAFKGQDLGKSYTWNELQKKGVSYEQARDREGLESYRSPIAVSRERENATRDIERDQNGIRSIAEGSWSRDSISIDANGKNRNGYQESQGEFRRDLESSKDGNRRSFGEDERGSSEVIREEVGSISLKNKLFVRADQHDEIGIESDGRGFISDQKESRISRENSSEREFSKSEFYNSGSKLCSIDLEQAYCDIEFKSFFIGNNDSSSVLDSQKQSKFIDSNGNKRIKSNEIFQNYQSKTQYIDSKQSEFNRISGSSTSSIIRAKSIDPTRYLESQGYKVRQEGQHMSVSLNDDEVYRITLKNDAYVSCDKYGNGVGDNISLIRDIDPGIGFMDAVHKLNGMLQVTEKKFNIKEKNKFRPIIPNQLEFNQEAGIHYLKLRGIDEYVIKTAEKQGFLRYSEKAVLFVGYDKNEQSRNITRRSIDPKEEVQKKDFKFSDKSFSPILKGNSDSIWIVEGGVDALAVHNLARLANKNPPTVIVSGGSNVRSFLENPDIQSILKQAKKITITIDKEKTQEIQLKTDREHEKQAKRIKELTGLDVCQMKPESGKDLAEYNLMVETSIRQEQEKEKIRLEKEKQIELEREHRHGLSL